MAPSERTAAVLLAAIATALGSIVVFDVYDDWQIEGKALATTVVENAVPLALVGVLLYGTYRLYEDQRSSLPTVARWTVTGVVGMLALGGLVLGIQFVQGEFKPYVLAAHVAIGGAVGGLVVGYYVAQVREARAEIRREKRRRESLFENTPTAIADLTVESDHVVVDTANDAFAERFTGEATAAGRPLGAVAPLGEVELDRSTLEEDTVRQADITHATGETERHYTLRVVPYSVPGEGARAYAIFTDITDERETQRELESTVRELERKNERLDQFVSVVSHDLRNPLSIAVGQLELARERDDPEALESVADALDRMDELIDDLLTLAREGESASDLQPVDLASAARSSWENVDTRGATLRVDADTTVVADPSRLRQLFENLFRNAVEHGSTGSQPEADDDLTVRVGSTDDGFYVEDDGQGIPEDGRESVFEFGFTTDDDGTGFGLTIVSEVARAHDWTVSVTDADGPTDADASGDPATDGGSGARFEITGVDRA